MKTRILLLASALFVLLILFLIILLGINVQGVTLFYDLKFIYSIDDLRRSMDVLTYPTATISIAELKNIRQRFELFYIIDVVFPIVYAYLLVSISQALQVKWTTPWIIVAMICDYVENIIILLFYTIFDVSILFTWILHIATIVKYTILLVVLGSLLSSAIKQRKTHKKTP